MREFCFSCENPAIPAGWIQISGIVIRFDLYEMKHSEMGQKSSIDKVFSLV